MQVIITLTAFSVFTLSLNLSSKAACCANQVDGACVTSMCSARLASTQGLTGACRRAAAPVSLSAKTAIFHRAVSTVTGRLSEALLTSPSLFSAAAAFSLPQVDAATERREQTSHVRQCHAQAAPAAHGAISHYCHWTRCQVVIIKRVDGDVAMLEQLINKNNKTAQNGQCCDISRVNIELLDGTSFV